ncbi:MAG: alanyl-tRNA editing protein, partial [Lachnospiraceae bacterium]|nr:alanyl-tRNA editing protein [Lachnospiraceae bacterium]
ELMKTHGGYCGVFVCTAVDNFAYIIGSKELDCREVGTALREHFDAKGGGKPEMIQGSVSGADAEKIPDFLQERYR